MKKLLIQYRDILLYLFFGGVTTAVNYLIYLLCYQFLGWDALPSNVLAWAVAVAVAFVTNKPFVFRSYDWSWKTLWPELTGFVGCRIGSGALESAFLWITVDMLNWNGIWIKLITAVIVIVLNYIGSKFLVFKKKA